MITIIAAMTEKNHVIGSNNLIPWSISEELQHFKKTTMNSSVIMGRKTFESLKKPLPNRQNIVLTRDKKFGEQFPITVCSSPTEAIIAAEYDNIFIIGGSEIYRLFLPLANYMILSFIKGNFDGDTFFPNFNENDWNVIKVEDYQKFYVKTLVKKNSQQ